MILKTALCYLLLFKTALQKSFWSLPFSIDYLHWEVSKMQPTACFPVKTWLFLVNVREVAHSICSDMSLK